MRITFIKPSMTGGPLGDAMEPLAFAIMAALTPPGVELRLHDERIEPLRLEEPTDLVAISCDTYSARRSYQIAAEYRRRGVPVVMGGCHPTLRTEEALRFAPSVVVGDAEDTWPAVVEDARRGRLKRLYQSQYPPLEGLRLDRSIFAGKKYGPLRLVQLGRGCNHACDFCSIHALYGRRIRYRPVDEVMREIEGLGARMICFSDDNLFANRARAVELMRRLMPLRIRWSCQASVEVATDEELLHLMAASGCLAVTVGFESLREGNLAQMRKGWNLAGGRYEELVGRFHAHGLMVYGSFVFGYDHDKPEDFTRTLDFATRMKLFLANFNPLTPMPGAALYERLRAEGRLLYEPWWLDPTYRYAQATFRPRGMSARELAEGVFAVRRQFNSLASIARRGLNFRANTRGLVNTGTFLAVNLINRREIYRKQGLALGLPGPLEHVLESAVA